MTSREEEKVASHKLSLRPAEEGDCGLLWEWRNEENTRKWSFNTDYVPYEEHKSWFLSKLNSADSKLLIVSDEREREIGQVRFDISQSKSAEINISIEASKRNEGYGSAALKLACQHALEKFNIAKVVAHIKEGNKASSTAFTKAGFINLGLKNFEEYKAIEMIWDKNSANHEE